MDINPLIVDLNKNSDELILSIRIAMGLHEIEKADEHIAHAIAEIKGESCSPTPFQQVADLYNLPVEEVVTNIRSFTNKLYKSIIPGEAKYIKDINFVSKI